MSTCSRCFRSTHFATHSRQLPTKMVLHRTMAGGCDAQCSLTSDCRPCKEKGLGFRGFMGFIGFIGLIGFRV